jgi:hypothetical protein
MRVYSLSGLGATGSEKLINLIDSIPLVDRSTAVSVVRDFEAAVADAAEARVKPQVEAAVKKGILISLGASVLIGFLVLRKARR